MSLNAIHRNVMVFSDDKDKAVKKMNEIVSNEEIIKRTKDFVEAKNGTFQAEKFTEACLVYRYREVYIDESLKENKSIIFLIKALLVPSHHYNGYERDENYKKDDHIHYFKGE